MSVSYWQDPARSGGRRGTKSGPGGQGGELGVWDRGTGGCECIGEQGVQTAGAGSDGERGPEREAAGGGSGARFGARRAAPIGRAPLLLRGQPMRRRCSPEGGALTGITCA